MEFAQVFKAWRLRQGLTALEVRCRDHAAVYRKCVAVSETLGELGRYAPVPFVAGAVTRLTP